MISLIAAAFEDGWAFIRQDCSVYLVRPPYRRERLVEVSEATVEQAIHTHGFRPELQSFPSLGALTEFLRRKVVEAAEARTSREKEIDAATRLLRHAPVHVIHGYLDRIEGELLPGGELHAALHLLTALSELEKVALDPALRARAARLQKVCVTALERRGAVRSGLADDSKDLLRKFPRAMERWGEDLLELMRAVRERRSLLTMVK